MKTKRNIKKKFLNIISRQFYLNHLGTNSSISSIDSTQMLVNNNETNNKSAINAANGLMFAKPSTQAIKMQK